MKYFVLISFFISSVFAFNIEIFNSTIENGKTAIIKFSKEENTKYEKIIVDSKTYKIYDNPLNPKEKYVLIPINYYEKPNNKKVEIFYNEKGIEKNKIVYFKVKDAKYEKEEIHVQKSKVNPRKKEVKDRIAKEYAQAMKIYNTFTPKSYISSKFKTPMKSKITSSFGKARVYNNSLKGYHSGTDYRAEVGTPVQASNDGIVVLVKDRFYAGKTVIIDHGQGIYTCYYHLSKFNVKEGQMVKKSSIIGLSGKSGRVTGPHLHFSVRVNGEQVDPLQLIELLNKNLF